MIWCSKCRRNKSEDEFPLNRSSRTGRQSYCKPCHNKYVLERKRERYGGQKSFLLNLRYGIDQETFDRMVESQGGLCAICGEEPAEHVDHSHVSGAVRGILCFNCNGGLGRFKDDKTVMGRAIEYLVRHGHR